MQLGAQQADAEAGLRQLFEQLNPEAAADRLLLSAKRGVAPAWMATLAVAQNVSGVVTTTAVDLARLVVAVSYTHLTLPTSDLV